MGAGGNDINKAIKDCIANDGYWHDLGVSLSDIRDTNGIPCTGATAPSVALSSAQLIATCAAASSSSFNLVFMLPPETADQAPGINADQPFPALRVGMYAVMATDTTDAPVVTVTAVAKGPSGAVKATFTGVIKPPTDGSVPTSAAVIYRAAGATLEYVWDFTVVLGTSSVKLAAGDTVTVNFAVATHTTRAMTVHGLYARAKVNASANAIQGTGNSDR